MEFGNRVGDRVRIHSGSTMEFVTIEDDVFIGPNTVFAGDPHPMNCPRYTECRGGAVVRRLARIGANVTIMPGVEIGEDSLVGAGSVVTDDVPPGSRRRRQPRPGGQGRGRPHLPARLLRAAVRLAPLCGHVSAPADSKDDDSVVPEFWRSSD